MAANEVVYGDSSETGAPVLNNVPGSLISVLDAFLITGWNSRSATLTVSGGVATLTASAHGWADQRMLDVAGVTGGPTGWAGLNGRKLVTVTGSNTVTFDATGIANGTAAGTITAKRSPLGWTKPFSGTNKAVYARSDVRALAQVLRIDDTATGAAAPTYARATMYESMTDVDTGSGAGPSKYVTKGASNTAAKPWILIGDYLSFYLFADNDFTTSGTLMPSLWFFDLISYKAGDAYSTYHQGVNTSSPGSNTSSFYSSPFTASGPSSDSIVAARASNQIGAYKAACTRSIVSNGVIGSVGPAYPSVVDNGLLINKPVYISDDNSIFGYPIRGEVPGIAYPFSNVGSSLHRKIIDNAIGDTRKYLAVTAFASGSTLGTLLFDITGPWQ